MICANSGLWTPSVQVRLIATIVPTATQHETLTLLLNSSDIASVEAYEKLGMDYQDLCDPNLVRPVALRVLPSL